MDKTINKICKHCDKPPELCSCPDQELIEITSEDSFAKGGVTKIVKLNIERSN